MRKWIDIINEAIVHKDRFVQQHNTKKTTIAINPTKAEWKANYPDGAAGVITRDGRIITGDGTSLDHSTIMDMAGVPYEQELCRLQIGQNGALAEIWISDETWNEIEHSDEQTKRSAVEKEVLAKTGYSLAQLSEILKEKVRPFLGDVPTRAIAMNFYQEKIFPEDQAFADAIVWKANINEAWDKTIDTPSGFVDIYRNPTNTEFRKLMKAWEGEGRLTFTEGGDVLLFDANLSTHNEVENHYHDIDERPTALVEMRADGTPFVMLHHAYRYGEEWITKWAREMAASAVMTRMLGKDFSVLAETDDGHTIDILKQPYRKFY